MNYGRLSRYAAFLVSCLAVASSVRAAPERSALSIPSDDAAHAGPAPLGPPQLGEPATVETLRAKADELARRFDALDYDTWLRAGDLGPGVEPTFRWVRDNVRFESYAGAFRGAKGAYIARAANAADRSLLLAELLKAKGFKTRFVTGRLPAARAEALFERIFAPDVGGGGGGAALGAEAANGADVESPQRREFLARVAARARRDYGVLRSALGDGLPTAASPSRDALLGEMAAHVWVQADMGDKWVDLDSAFADAEPGQTFCEPGEAVGALPPEMLQHMTIRVVVERLNGRALESDVVLELTKPVTDLVGQHAAFFHLPENAGASGGPAALGHGLGGLAGGAAPADPNTRIPALALGLEVFEGKPVRFDDGTVPAAAPRRSGGLTGLGGGGGGDAAAAGAGPQLVAEFLEFELTFPGGAKETTRRVIFDRGGAAWRAGAAHDAGALRPLARDSRGPIDASSVHNIWFSGGRHDMAAYAKHVKRLARAAESGAARARAADGAAAPGRAGGGGGRSGRAGATPGLATQIWLLGLQNFPVVAAGDHDLIPALNDDPSARFYLDSPRILVFSLGVDLGDGGQAAAGAAATAGNIETQIDLRRDKVRGVARTAGSAAAVARRKLWFGLLGGALEHEVIATQAAVAAGPDGPPGTVASTSALLDGGGGGAGAASVVVLRPGEGGADALKQLGCGPDAAMRLSGAMSRGELLVVPRAAFADGGNDGGYWAVSATTGDLRAVWGPDLHAGRSHSGLNNPMTRRSVVHHIHDDLSSTTTEAGTEYIAVTNKVAIESITFGEYVGAGIAIVIEITVIWLWNT